MRGSAGTLIRRLRGDLDRSLFPSAQPGALRFRGWEGALVLACFFAFAMALQFLRAGPEDSIKALFAEDGPVYLKGGLEHGFFDSLTTGYAEYLVVIPRLIGEVATLPPLRYAPEAMNLTAVFLVALSALAVWIGSAGLVRSTYLRALLVALVLVPPAAGLETVVSATNVPWYTSYAVFWLLLWRPETTWGAALGALLILLSGLSSPVYFFFLPLAALRAIAIRDVRDGLLVAAFGIALTIQLPVTLLSTEPVTDPTWTTNILTTFLQRVVSGSAIGLELSSDAWTAWGWPFLVAITVAVAVVLIALAVRATSGRLFALIAVATAVVMFLVSGYQRSLGDVMVWPLDFSTTLGGRYAMIPALLVASAAIVLADSPGRKPRARPWPAFAVAAVGLLAIVTSFGGDANREMPSWSGSVRGGAVLCHDRNISEVTLFVSPEGWSMPISCQDLESEYAAPAP
jgi:hypothetical protein